VFDNRVNKSDDFLGKGFTDPIAEAVELAGTSDVAHGYEVTRTQTGDEIRDEIKRGEIDDLEGVMCNEFTSATVAASEYDLDERYLNQKSKIPIAYPGKGGTTFVEIWMVVGTLREATAAILAVQGQSGVEKVTDPERAAELGVSGGPSEFWYFAGSTFVGVQARGSHHFGAGAAAVALGGYDVDAHDRKPGDVQQWLKTSNGTYDGLGQSSVVHEVKGSGVARLGAANCPEIDGDVRGPGTVDELGNGWFRIEPGSGLEWILGPETDPMTVAEFTAEEIQLIDANEQRGDATQVGSYADVEDFDAEETTTVTSSGRLPTSKWFAWKPSVLAVLAVLSTSKPQATAYRGAWTRR